MDIAECSLAELVEDPLVGLVMKSDGVDRDSIELLFARIGNDRAQVETRSHQFPSAETAPCLSC
jgi:hypothetical protein